MLHGTGGTEHDLIDLGEAVAPGTTKLSPRGRVLENGMPRFFRRFAEGVFDEEDLVRRAGELAEFVSDATAKYETSDDWVALGYSNGANIAAALLLLYPGLLKGAIMFRAMVPLRPQFPVDLKGTPVLIIGGQNDSLIPTDQVEDLAGLLQSDGAKVETAWLRGGHGLATEDVEIARRWFCAHFNQS